MKTRNVLNALAAALLLSSNLLAQGFQFNGVVKNEANEPIEGARVKVAAKDGDAFQSTQQDGTFSFGLQPSNQLIVEVRAIGYQTVQQTWEVDGKSEFYHTFVLAERFTTTEEVIIASTRPPQTAPISQVTRNREDIERIYQGQDGAFLLEELSPSIVSYSESGTNLSNYAGIRLRGIDQTRVNMTLNGVPLNDMIDQGVFFSNFTDFGNSIESVQIQRGVGTSANGTSSYAGSINFESINLENSDAGGSVMFTTGAFGTIRGGAEVQSGLLENNTAFYLRYTETHADGFRDNMGTNARSFFFSGGYFGEKHSVKLTGFNGRSKNGLGYLPVAISDIENNPRTNYVSENDQDDFGQHMVQLQHVYELNQNKSLVNTIYYGGAGGSFPFGFEDENGDFLQINYPLFNQHIGAMSNFNGAFFKNQLKLSAGVHGYRFNRNNIEQIVPNFSSPYYDDRSRKDELSAFTKLAYSWNNFEFFGDLQARGVQLSLEPDAAFLGTTATIPTRDWFFLNTTAGVTYKVNKNWNAYASFGRTGREPTRFDILGATQINPANLPIAQDLNQVVPEYVNNLETGMRWNSKKVNVQANVFYMQFENEIAPIGEFIEQGFVQVYRNQQPSVRYGVELDASYQFLPKFRIAGNATYMEANISQFEDINTGDVFENISPILTPNWNVQTVLTYEPFEKLALDLRGRYLSEAFMELTNDRDFMVPSSFVFDARLRYQFHKKHSINIQFNNLLDTQYFTYGAPVFALNGNFEPGYFVQPPRHIYVTLLLNF